MGGAQLTQQQNLRPVFLVGLGGQCALYLVLLLVQDDVEDTGLCIFLLFFGAILLGLQSAQSVDHWKQHKGGGDAGHLLYKLTKRMSFHGKMIFFPMVFIIITMSAATNSLHIRLVLQMNDSSIRCHSCQQLMQGRSGAAQSGG